MPSAHHSTLTAPLSEADFSQRFAQLDALLLAQQALWQPRPFVHRHLPWEAQHPELGQWLRQQSLAHAEAAHNQPHLIDAPAPFPQLAQQAAALSQIGALPEQPLGSISARLSSAVPGRKWQQIQAFASRLNFQQTPQHWLDWCAGKGHLGRLLAQSGAALTCLEYDAELVAAGQQLSAKQQIPAAHIQQDVLAADAHLQLGPQHSPVALHACGELHTRLLQLASAAGCGQLAVAPCCYNRIRSDFYQPLSRIGQASELRLSREDLALPLSETVTAPSRVRQQRDASMARRLAFDELQRTLRGSDTYLPTPSLPSAWLDKPFAQYCSDLAALKDLPPIPPQDWQALEQQGWQRLAQVRNLELVRGLFRRPLELWLLLDLGLFLHEQGYRVQLGSFCAYQQSPRNLLLLAQH